MRDYYDVLGVSRDATSDEIKRAYRQLAHKYHPDKHAGDAANEEKFKELTEAYNVLSDPDAKRSYDRFGFAQGAPGPAGGPQGHSRGVGDVFSEIFGDFFGRQKARPTKGRNREMALDVDFAMAVFGGETVLHTVRSKRCGTCRGTGAAPGTSPQVCHACGGTGEIRVQQGLLDVGKKCTYCRARGKIIAHPCAECQGRGTVDKQVRLKVRVPAGADDETVLRFAGEGEPGAAGGPPGDLMVRLRVSKHPLFERDGADIRCEVPISLMVAALGGRIEVPALDGSVRMTIPKGTQNGRVFRLRGKGAKRPGGGDGDQLVAVVIEVPLVVDAEDEAVLKALERMEDDAHHPIRADFRRQAERVKKPKE